MSKTILLAGLLAAALAADTAVAASPRAQPPALVGTDRDECARPLLTRPAAAPAGFTHRRATVDGVRMHYVIGGRGEQVVVLLHGWPQTWYEWAELMPGLARDYTVIAVDLPGLGDSRGAPRAFDKKTLAGYVHRLVVDRLGHRRVHVVGHDFGGGVAFAYAAFHREAAASLTVMDYPVSGPAIDPQQLGQMLWHFALHMIPRLPEQLVTGRQRTYFEWFYDNFAAAPNRIEPAAVTEFVRAYCQPGKLHAGFELYRSLDTDTADNLPLAQDKLTLPVLGMSARPGPTTMDPMVAAPIRLLVVPDSGHWLPEENPAFVGARLREFLGSVPG